MKKVGIIGYGRFGRMLTDLLSKKYEVLVTDINSDQDKDVGFAPLEKILDCFLVFLAVPIRSFEAVIKEISQYKLYNTTIVDVCSVKVYPVMVMEKHLPKHVGIIASHPHFGPDSYSPFRELKITLCQVRDTYKRYKELKLFFELQSIRIIKMTPDEHDKMAASSQGITHLIGRALNESGVRSTEINTLGFNELLSVIEQTCNDSWDLFQDLQIYNPYTNEMIDNFVASIENVYNKVKQDAN